MSYIKSRKGYLMSKTFHTKSEINKAGLIYLGISLAVIIPLTLLLYVPIWNHNHIALVIGAILTVGQVLLNLRDKTIGYMFLNLGTNIVMFIGVWNHLWFLIVGVLAFAVIKGAIAFRSSRDKVLREQALNF